MADPAGWGGGAEETAASPGKSQRIGDTLIALGLITPDQLDIALREKERSPSMLGAILIDLGFIDAAALIKVLADTAGVERFAGEPVDVEDAYDVEHVYALLARAGQQQKVARNVDPEDCAGGRDRL